MNLQIDLNKNGLEEYPWSVVVLENIVLALWVLSGTFLIWHLSTYAGFAYFAIAFAMILVIMRKLVCTRCYYYGKRCHVGWGKISAALFSKGDIAEFNNCSGSKIAPVFFGLLALIPVLSGIAVLYGNPAMSSAVVFAILLASIFHSSVLSRKRSCGQCKMNRICPGSAVK